MVQHCGCFRSPQAGWVLCFQQHSRFRGVTTFVFNNIPAFPPPVKRRPFVFIDIPASFVHFLKLLILSFPAGGDIMS